MTVATTIDDGVGQRLATVVKSEKGGILTTNVGVRQARIGLKISMETNFPRSEHFQGGYFNLVTRPE